MNQLIKSFKPIDKNITVNEKDKTELERLKLQFTNNPIALCECFLVCKIILSNQYHEYSCLFDELDGLYNLIWEYKNGGATKNRSLYRINYLIRDYMTYVLQMIEYVMRNSNDDNDDFTKIQGRF